MHAMRHSEERLTTRVYTDAKLLPVADHVQSLPSFGEGSVSPILSQLPVSDGRERARHVTDVTNEKSPEVAEVESLRREPACSVTVGQSALIGSGGRVRTYDLVVNSHPLYR